MLELYELDPMEDQCEDHAGYDEYVENRHGRREDANRNPSSPLDESEKRRNGCLHFSKPLIPSMNEESQLKPSFATPSTR